MDAMVTARVPLEIKEQGNAVLKSIGATATDLINAAFAYVIKNKELPQAKANDDVDSADSSARELSQTQRAELRDILKSMSVPVPDSIKGKSFDELRDGMWEDRNARFA